MSNRVSLMLLLLFSVIPNVKTDGNHYNAPVLEKIYHEESNVLSLFCLPIKFTRPGIRCFLRHAFNKPEYSTEFLPYNFTHMIQFLKYGTQTEQSDVYMQSIIRLFYNKLKSTHFITSYALHELLEPMPQLIQNYCTAPHKKTLFVQLKTSVNNLLYNSFLENFAIFKKEPETFFDTLSTTIFEEMHDNIAETHVNQEQFRQTIIRFLEIALSKVIWYQSNGKDTWQSVKLFAHQVHRLHEADIIDENELDDLYKSILERFCYHLNACGAGMSLEAITQIREDIASKKLHLLELEEQETCLENKAKRLQRALVITEAKIHAYAQGIIT